MPGARWNEDALPKDGFDGFWQILESDGDEIWQDWPYNHQGGGIGNLPDGVNERIAEGGFVASISGVFYQPGEMCLNGAFLDGGVAIPFFRLCEQADGCAWLVIVRYAMFFTRAIREFRFMDSCDESRRLASTTRGLRGGAVGKPSPAHVQ